MPFSPETKRSGVGSTLRPGETLWYRRDEVEEDLDLTEGRRLLLHFGAVDERCAVYWNGRKVGSHRNGYLAFSFDVTEFVRPGTNELKVFVRDDTDEGNECRGKQTPYAGRHVLYCPERHLADSLDGDGSGGLSEGPEDHTALKEEAVELELGVFQEPRNKQEVRITVGEPGKAGMQTEVGEPRCSVGAGNP